MSLNPIGQSDKNIKGMGRSNRILKEKRSVLVVTLSALIIIPPYREILDSQSGLKDYPVPRRNTCSLQNPLIKESLTISLSQWTVAAP